MHGGGLLHRPVDPREGGVQGLGMLLTAQRPPEGGDTVLPPVPQDPPGRPAIPVRSACWGRKATELSPNCPQK
jgi:hypothetical protein